MCQQHEATQGRVVKERIQGSSHRVPVSTADAVNRSQHFLVWHHVWPQNPSYSHRVTDWRWHKRWNPSTTLGKGCFDPEWVWLNIYSLHWSSLMPQTIVWFAKCTLNTDKLTFPCVPIKKAIPVYSGYKATGLLRSFVVCTRAMYQKGE